MEVGDTAPNGHSNTSKYASDGRTDFNSLIGAAAQSSATASASGKLWPNHESTSASGSAFASASSIWGSLHAAASGAGSADLGITSVHASAAASFQDFLSCSSANTAPINVHFGYGISSSVSADFGAFVTAHGHGSVYDVTADKMLWASQEFVNRTVGTVSNTMSESVDLMLDPTHGFRLDGVVEASGSANFNSDTTNSASFSADASHTGELWFKILSPGVSYVTSSGATYLTAPTWAAPVPEPSTYAMFMFGLGLLSLRYWRKK